MDRELVIKKIKYLASFFQFLNIKLASVVIADANKMNFVSNDDYYRYAVKELKKLITVELNKQYKENPASFFSNLLKFKSEVFSDSNNKLSLLSLVIGSIDEEIDTRVYNVLLSKHNALRSLLKSCSLNDKKVYEDLIVKYPNLKSLFDVYISFIERNALNSVEFDSNAKVLSYDEVKELYKRMENGDITVKETLIKRNMNLVNKIALHTYKSGKGGSFDFDDLVQCGMLGLMEAIDRYDPEKEVNFSTYASCWISGIMFREINRSGSMVKIPEYLKTRNKKIAHGIEVLTWELGREPTFNEIQQKLKLRKDELMFFYDLNNFKNLSLYMNVGIDNKSEFIDFLESFDDESDNEIIDLIEAKDDCIENFNNQIVAEKIMDAVRSSLSDKEYEVIKNRFGFDGGAPKTLEAIGSILKVTTERVRQLENRALKKIRGNRDFFQLFMSDKNKEIFDRLCSVCDNNDVVNYMVYRTGLVGNKARTPSEISEITSIKVTLSLENNARKLLENHEEFKGLLPKFNEFSNSCDLREPKKGGKKAKSFMELLKEKYSEEEIEFIISNLNKNQRDMLILRYGENLDTVNENFERINKDSIKSMLFRIRNKINKMRIDGVDSVLRKPRKVKAKSFMDILKGLYTDEEVNKIIASLSDEQKEFLALRYGENLDTVNNDLDPEIKAKICKMVFSIKKKAPMCLVKEEKEFEVEDLPKSSLNIEGKKLIKKLNK